MSPNNNPQKGNAMTEEEALFTEVDNILKDANEQEAERYKHYVKTVALQVENTIYEEYGAEETYQLWSLNMAHKGTPESIEEFKTKALEEQPEAVNLTIKDDDDAINSCLEMEIAYAAMPGMPSDINGLLADKKAMILVHAKRSNLVGFVARTGGWASAKARSQDIRPIDADDRMSVTMTVYFASGMMVVIPRDDKTKQVIEDNVHVVDVFSPTDDTFSRYEGHTNAQIAEACAEYLGNTYGRVLSALYMAYAYPKALMYDDLEMYQAMTKDALLAFANEETEQE